MSDLRKAAEMALEHLESISDWDCTYPIGKAKEALRQALAQLEPISYVPGFYRGEKISLSRIKLGERFILVRTGEIYSKTKDGYWNEYEQRPARLHLNCQVQLIKDTAPPKREWVGLTDEEVESWRGNYDFFDSALVREIEAKLKEKNT